MKNKAILFIRDYEKLIESIAIFLLIADFLGLVWFMCAGMTYLATATLFAPAVIAFILILCMLVPPKTMKHVRRRKSLVLFFGMGNIFYAAVLVFAAIFVSLAENTETKTNYDEHEQIRMIVIFLIMALIQLIGLAIAEFREKRGEYDKNPDLGKKDYSRLLKQTMAVAAGFALAYLGADALAVKLLFSFLYLEQAWYEIDVLIEWVVEKLRLRLEN